MGYYECLQIDAIDLLTDEDIKVVTNVVHYIADIMIIPSLSRRYLSHTCVLPLVHNTTIEPFSSINIEYPQ